MIATADAPAFTAKMDQPIAVIILQLLSLDSHGITWTRPRLTTVSPSSAQAKQRRWSWPGLRSPPTTLSSDADALCRPDATLAPDAYCAPIVSDCVNQPVRSGHLASNPRQQSHRKRRVRRLRKHRIKVRSPK